MSIRPDERPIDVVSPTRRRLWPPMHTALVVFDINHFGDQRRGNDIQLYLREAMYELIGDAFLSVSPNWDSWYREDRGDGVFIVAPPCVPAEALMDPLAHHLLAGLRRRNRVANAVARLQLRMAVHAGQIHRDSYGIAGHAAVHVFRLLGAPTFKKVATSSDADLALIVSDQLYTDARHSGFIDTGAYQSLRVSAKETRTRAWVWLPPVPRQGSPFRPT